MCDALPGRSPAGPDSPGGAGCVPLPPHQRARAGIGYVPQGRDVIPQLTVRDNLRLGLEARPGGLARHDRLDPQVFDLFPALETMLERRGGDLSGGQQQQLAMARALQGKPQLLLLDEPTEGIQPNVVADIETAVQRIMARTGVSVLLVEQHLHFVRQAHTYYAMQKGGIVASGPTGDLSQAVINPLFECVKSRFPALLIQHLTTAADRKA